MRYGILENETGYIDGVYSHDDLNESVKAWDEMRPEYTHSVIELGSEYFLSNGNASFRYLNDARRMGL